MAQWRHGGPVLTFTIIGICVAMWLLEWLFQLTQPALYNTMMGNGMFLPVTALKQPWTWFTSMFLHAPNIFHVLFNMIALVSVGPELERMMGHWQFLALYVISGLGAATGLVLWGRFFLDAWAVPVYGASGALFGLFAALIVAYRRVGADIRSMLVWMAINFAMPLFVPNIAWQAHVGGFITGGVLTWLLVSGPRGLRRMSLIKRMLIYGIAVVAVLLVIVVSCLVLTVGWM